MASAEFERGGSLWPPLVACVQHPFLSPPFMGRVLPSFGNPFITPCTPGEAVSLGALPSPGHRGKCMTLEVQCASSGPVTQTKHPRADKKMVEKRNSLSIGLAQLGC